VISYLTDLMVHGNSITNGEKKPLNIYVSAEQLSHAGSRPDEWLTYSGSVDGRRYTPLSEINASNVSQLHMRWIQQFDSLDPVVESTPLVANGTIFVTEPPSSIVALDA